MAQFVLLVVANTGENEDEEQVEGWAQHFLRGLEGSIYEATLVWVRGEGKRVNLQEDD